MNIKNKTAIVTGSAKRVGRAIALTLAQQGANVVVHYRSSAQDAEKTAQEIRQLGRDVLCIKADLTSVKELERLAEKTIKHFGTIDILVNSASLYEKNPFGRIREQDWDAHLNANLKGVFFLSQAVGKQMLKQKRGKIVNIIDSDVHHPYNGYLPYMVSKSGLVGLTYCLAKELAPNIQVNAISPGPVLMQKDWGPKVIEAILKVTPLRRIGSPQDIANGVLFCIEGTDFMTGAIIPIDGGQHIA